MNNLFPGVPASLLSSLLSPSSLTSPDGYMRPSQVAHHRCLISWRHCEALHHHLSYSVEWGEGRYGVWILLLGQYGSCRLVNLIQHLQVEWLAFCPPMEVNILTAFPRDSSLNHLKIGMVLYWRMGQRQGKCVYHNVVGGMAIMHQRYYWSQWLGLILARTAWGLETSTEYGFHPRT